MQLESDRLLFKKITHSEFSAYARWYMNDEVMKYITGRALTLEETKLRFAKAMETNEKYPELGLFSVKSKQHQRFIGIAKLVYLNEYQAEVGYGMMPEYWGKGYASEILKTIINYAESALHVSELVAIVDPQNQASKKVLAKQHFHFLSKGSENTKPTEHFRLLLPVKSHSNNV
ncbi:ribosomal-protein-alanine N-acetyltransferase [Catalinimonas alkaloidigena]|uniref:GNAT family N-acetyltransferase n=1 Tax=Catalinimonas alkaloidigena TaxID=1075417 RepID=UPI00240558F3|nr:GNAT family N-acetyltransferase [Catalinimonas alkaloidigena]MDF9796081.1 ribosomal-protein-alanine N-acetyltransferase [Catalinimonas alkaloidigena]